MSKRSLLKCIFLSFIVLLLIIFLFGLDEPIVNLTINQPDLKCNVNSDCLGKFTGGESLECSDYVCANEKWQPYKSVIKNVFATSCGYSPKICTCQNNRCKTTYLKGVQDPTICDDINSNEKYGCYSYIAKVRNDTSICNNIKEEFYVYLCYSDVAIEKLDSAICGRIKNVEEKDQCYDALGRAKQEFASCDKIANENKKMWCYISLAETKKDISVCRNVENIQDNAKDLCYSSVAKVKLDPSICENIRDEIRQYSCYTPIAVEIQEPNICNALKVQKDFCYIEVATKKRDKTICEKILSQERKADCYTRFS